MIYDPRKVHQKHFSDFHQEQGCCYEVDYNVHFWYQETLQQPTRHKHLALEKLPIMFKTSDRFSKCNLWITARNFGTTQDID